MTHSTEKAQEAAPKEKTLWIVSTSDGKEWHFPASVAETYAEMSKYFVKNRAALGAQGGGFMIEMVLGGRQACSIRGGEDEVSG